MEKDPAVKGDGAPAGTSTANTQRIDNDNGPEPVYEGQGSQPVAQQSTGLVSPISEHGDQITSSHQERDAHGTAPPTYPGNDTTNSTHPQPVGNVMSTDSPAHPDLTNRPAGMTPREAAEKREAEILGRAPRSNFDHAALPVGHVVPLTSLREKAMPVDCPGCHRMVTTIVDKHLSDRGTMWSVILCLCCGVLCFWIPLVMDEFKDTEHKCPNCCVVLAVIDSEGKVQHTYTGPVRAQPSAYAQPQYQQQQPHNQEKQEYGQVQSRAMDYTSQPQASTSVQQGQADQAPVAADKSAVVHEMEAGVTGEQKK